MTGACQNSPLRWEPSPVEYGAVLYDAGRMFNPLLSGCLVDYQVTSVRDGVAVFSVAMPEGMVSAFAAMLTSQGELFGFIENKRRIKVAESKAIDLDEITQRQKYVAKYQQVIIETFDSLVKQGHPPKEALKLTNRALKAQGYPWATYDNVSSVLRAGGRFRRIKTKTDRKGDSSKK